MSKTNLFLVTLVAAVPAGYLLFLLGSAIIGGNGPSGMLQIVSGLAILCALAIALMPVGALVFSPAGAPKPAKKAKKDEESAAEEDFEDAEAGEAAEESGGEFDDEFGGAAGESGGDEWEGVEFDDEDDEDE